MKNNRYDRFFRRKGYLSKEERYIERKRNIIPNYRLTVFASVAKQTPGRVNFRMLLSPIVGVADTSPEGGSKKYVILSVSEISHRKSKQNILRRPTPSREFASLRSQRQSNFLCHCEAQSAAAIPWSKARSIYRVLFQGDRHANYYSALNADALKLSFFAFFIKNASLTTNKYRSKKRGRESRVFKFKTF